MYIELDWSGGTAINSAHTIDSGDISGIFNGVTNLYVANKTPTTLDVTSDTGLDATIPSATTSLAGLQSSADKTKLDGLTAGATVNSSDATLLNRTNHTGTQTASTISDFTTVARTSVVNNSIGSGITTKAPSEDAVFNALFTKVDKVGSKVLSTEDYSTSDKTKLATVSTGATANFSDTTLLARINHTGTQLASTISDFSTAADARVVVGITGKFNTPSGSTSQYLRGDGSTATLPTIPSITGLRKAETFLGTTDGSGNYTITFANTYASAPDIQPQIVGGSFIQFVRAVSVSTTGAVVQAAQRNTINLLSTELLLGTTVALVGASVSILVTARS